MDELIRRVMALEERLEAMSENERRQGALRLLKALKSKGVALQLADVELIEKFGDGNVSFDALARGFGDRLLGL